MSSQKQSDKTGPRDLPAFGIQKAGLLPSDRIIRVCNVGDILFDRYRITDKKEGENSTIYKAIDSSTNAIVAIKEVNLGHCIAQNEQKGKSKGFKPLDLVKREFRAGISLSHQYLTSYHEAFEDKETGAYFLVREWAHGKSLSEMILEGKRFTDEEIVLIAEKVLAALEYLHSKNPPIIHRDIKPANIIVKTENGQLTNVKLIDLGAISEAPNRKDPNTRMTTHIYTPGFGAPESISNPCPSSDLFSVGATILFLKTNLDADDIYHIDDASFNIPESVTGRLRVVLEGSLQAPGKNRFCSASEMRTTLLGLAIEKRAPIEELEIAESLSEKYKAKNSLIVLDKDWDPGNIGVRIVMGGASLSGGVCGSAVFFSLYGVNWPILSIATGFFLGTTIGGLGVTFLIQGIISLGYLVIEKFKKNKLRQEIEELEEVVSAHLINGKITSGRSQEKLASLIAGAYEQHKIGESKIFRILNSGVLVSEKAEEILASLVVKPNHSRKLLKSGKIHSFTARAILASKIPGYMESEKVLADSPPIDLLMPPEKKEK